jgi:hypothetical protein
LSHTEVQEVLKAHIEKETGRKVRGDIYVTSTCTKLRDGEETHGRFNVTSGSAITHLESNT